MDMDLLEICIMTFNLVIVFIIGLFCGVLLEESNDRS